MDLKQQLLKKIKQEYSTQGDKTSNTDSSLELISYGNELKEKWSEKYKKSIDCNNPKGFSQRAHCQGKKKKVKEEIDEAERTFLAKLKDLARKHAYDDSKDSTTKERIEKMFSILKKQYLKGIKVEKEHKSADPRKIALDHLAEDPKYYDKLEKMEAKEATSTGGSSGGYEMPLFGKIETKEQEDWTKKAQTNIDDVFSNLPKLKDLKPFGLKYSVKSLKNLLLKKTRPDGTFGDNKWKREEMPFPPELDILNVIFQSRLAKYYFTQEAKKKGKHHYDFANLITKESLDNFPIPESVFVSIVQTLKNGDDEVTKIEATEATSSSSSGQYSGPAFGAKSMSPKDWRGRAKTLYPGGSFVQVKKKCKNFPYCNQGDINALKLTNNKRVKKAAKKLSEHFNLSEDLIIELFVRDIMKNYKK